MRPLSRLVPIAVPLAIAALGASTAWARPVVPRDAGRDRNRPAVSTASASTPDRGSLFRAHGDQFEVRRSGSWHRVYVRGINLGAAPPGHFPGEFAITKADYQRWLRFTRALHANAIRVYALHPPAFYEALREENDAHPDDPIWLFQEVWTELPEGNDFWNPRFMRSFDEEIHRAVDAIHGNALIAPRPGHASGRYGADVSRYLAGWLLGREWEPYAVLETQARHPEKRSYAGTFFEVAGGTAMESWLARACDTAARYESARYGLAHALSFVSWPTLDPMRHPTEYERGGRPAEHDEDAESVDPLHIHARREPSPESGFLGYFADYHAYPYYPDFMNLDPGYGAFHDAHGACNYAGYLTDLKAHTRGIPLLIGEVGVPNSRGIAHQQPQGIHHGGMSEVEQGRMDVRLLEDARAAGCAGSLLFALFDEWFKVNWLVQKTEQPRERDPLWHNLLDPEESYGLIGFDPPPAIHVDGDTTDWAGVPPYAVAAPAESASGAGAPLRALYVTSDQNRLYLRVDLAQGALERVRAFGVMLDVLDPGRGDHRLPAPLRATWSRGAEYALVVDPGAAEGAAPRAELFIDGATNWSVFARRLVGGRFDGLHTPYRPVADSDGIYLPLLVETNRERVSRSGKVYPALHLDWGRLQYGREPGRAAAWPGADSAYAYDPHEEWCFDAARRTVEIAIPWGLLSVGDPSSRRVVDDRDGTPEVETSVTDGIALLAWATTARGFEADSLGPTAPGAGTPAGPAECQFMGAHGTVQSVVDEWVTIRTPPGAIYLWNGWEMPITEERVKRSAPAVRDAFEGMEARDTNSGLRANDR